MAPNTARKLATIDDLLALPEDARAELIDGVIVPKEAARTRHNYSQAALIEELRGPFQRGRGGPGGWWILPEQMVRISEHRSARADLAGWRHERLASPPWDDRVIDVAPDWVCEILSPSNEGHDRITKADYYTTIGVPYYWLVNPSERILEAYELRDRLWVRTGAYGDTAVARIAPFEAIELDVGALFPPRQQ
jgi:Uma2 family endonuclease